MLIVFWKVFGQAGAILIQMGYFYQNYTFWDV